MSLLAIPGGPQGQMERSPLVPYCEPGYLSSQWGVHGPPPGAVGVLQNW